MEQLNELPDELILTIFAHLRNRPKSLIRCYSVCKRFASLVSEIDSISVLTHPPHSTCTLLHDHYVGRSIPKKLHKVFENLKSIEIELCLFDSPETGRMITRFNSGTLNRFRMLARSHAKLYGALSSTESFYIHFWTVFASSHFIVDIFPYCPSSLDSIVMRVATELQFFKTNMLILQGKQQLDHFARSMLEADALPVCQAWGADKFI